MPEERCAEERGRVCWQETANIMRASLRLLNGPSCALHFTSQNGSNGQWKGAYVVVAAPAVLSMLYLPHSQTTGLHTLIPPCYSHQMVSWAAPSCTSLEPARSSCASQTLVANMPPSASELVLWCWTGSGSSASTWVPTKLALCQSRVDVTRWVRGCNKCVPEMF